jgi:hypothetical protein
MITLLYIIGYLLAGLFTGGIVHRAINFDGSHNSYWATPIPMFGCLFWPVAIVILTMIWLGKAVYHYSHDKIHLPNKIHLPRWGYNFGEYILNPTLPQFFKKRGTVPWSAALQDLKKKAEPIVYTGTIYDGRPQEEIEAEAEVEEITRQSRL